jgi:hypothetical protein
MQSWMNLVECNIGSSELDAERSILEQCPMNKQIQRHLKLAKLANSRCTISTAQLLYHDEYIDGQVRSPHCGVCIARY